MTYSVDQIDFPGIQVDATEAPPPRSLRGWLLLVMMAASLLFYRQLLWYLGFHAPQRVISAVSSVALLFALAGAAWSARRSLPPIPARHAFTGRLFILSAWIGWLVAWGMIRGNYSSEIFKDAIGSLVLVLLLFLGRYDAVWHALRKPLTVFFYIALIAVLLTYRIPSVSTGFEGTVDLKIAGGSRNLNTIGFGLGGIIQIALLLGAWGMAENRKSMWSWLMIGSLLAYLIIEVLLFKFRGALVSLAAVIFLFALLTSRARGRLKIGTMLATILVAGIVLGIASQTQEFESLMRRFGEGELFHSRITETQAFFNDMGPLDLLAGRGMGGWYEGPHWAPVFAYTGTRLWTVNHFGFLAFVLRGGFPLLLFVTSFAIPVILPKLPGWRQNNYNFTAMILTPVLIYNILLNPVSFEPGDFLLLLMWGFCFARFATAPAPQGQETIPATYEEPYYAY